MTIATVTMADATQRVNPRKVVEAFDASGYRQVFWPGDNNDWKGPRDDNWPDGHPIANYREGYRIGLVTGTEIQPGKHVTDIDLDWAPGSAIAIKLLPNTDFVFGRTSKPVSHMFYTCEKPQPSVRFEDPDGTCLLEIRGTKSDGTIGMMTMVPPSIWSKGTHKEALTFVSAGDPAHVPADELRLRATYTAIALLLAKNLGTNGFGHEPRLMVSGFLLRLKIAAADVIAIGEAISPACNNTEIHDVRTSVESTCNALADPKKKVKGGPALAKHFGVNGKRIIATINSWMGRDDYARSANGEIVKDSQANIRFAIAECEVDLGYDEFAEQEVIRDLDSQTWLPLDDAEHDALWLRIDDECKFRPTFSFYEKVVRNLARENAFHPVKTYLNSLVWDGTPRIETWLMTYGGADACDVSNAKYVSAVSSIMLKAAVKRAFEPGAKYDEIVVLESEQGLNKSSALAALCPNRDWFTDDLPLNVDSKQMIERTINKWIVEASDLAGKKKAEIEQLKAMLSRQIDGPARMAYARKPVQRPRHFIIVGTTNSSAYLNDSTGNRRFWPVRVKKFDIEKLIRDRDQLWAEAVDRVQHGDSIRLPEELWEVAGEHQEARREVDPWEYSLHDCLASIDPSGDGKRRVTSTALLASLNLDTARCDRTAQMRVSEIMQRLGYERTKVFDKQSKRTVAGYVEKQTSAFASTELDGFVADIFSGDAS